MNPVRNQQFWLIILVAIVLVVIFAIFASSEKDAGNDTAAVTKNERQIGTRVGDIAPPFTINTIDGKTVSLNDFKGKKALVLTSTASWCPTCIIEAMQFAAVYPRFKDTAEFLSVSIDPTDDGPKLETFKKKYVTPWFYTHPNLPGVREMILDYRFDRFEITYVIDTNGVIRFKDRDITSADILQEELEKLAGKAPKEELGVSYDDQ